MANRLHISDASSISVDTLVLTDKAGTGNCIISAPSGQSYQLLGSRMGYVNLDDDRAIDISESNTVWTNTGSAAITVVLPNSAPNGNIHTFLRTGDTVTINPNTLGSIWHITSGTFDDIGEPLVMASSGAKLTLIADGSEGWYPTFYEGTITQ